MEIVQLFDEGSAIDISLRLRQSADGIEQESEDDDRTQTCVCVMVLESGALEVYGWGRGADRLRTIGILIEASKIL